MFVNIWVSSSSIIIPFIKILSQKFSRLNEMERNWRNNQKGVPLQNLTMLFSIKFET